MIIYIVMSQSMELRKSWLDYLQLIILVKSIREGWLNGKWKLS